MASDLRAFFDRLFALPEEIAADDAEFLYDDSTDAGALRLHNLRHYLTLLAERKPTTMLIGEAPGWRGATNTGASFMSMREITARPGLITGEADGDGFRMPEHPTAEWEASSRVVWKALSTWRGPLPVLWAIYPNHPFESGSPQTNRAPRPAEVRAGTAIALELTRAFEIGRLVAVGRKAQGALAANGVDALAVRHPAQGGATQFAEQLLAINAEDAAQAI